MRTEEKRSGLVRNIIRVVLLVVLAVLLAAAGYVIYVLVSFHRIGDMALTAEGSGAQQVQVNREHRMLSWNIGFGAYEDDYGFFMDGGSQSWAWSKERLRNNLGSIAEYISSQDADFYLFQEVDMDSTRSYHVDEREVLKEILPEENWQSVFAQNYDSPFLLFPLTQPHGASKSGIYTFSSCQITSAMRKELPIETGLTKFLDLDRCYSTCRIQAENGRELVLYNFHLSAYTSDGTIATEQLEILLKDMQEEYEAGNYCIAGGDFNKDLLGDSSRWFGVSDREYTWAQPIPETMFEGIPVSLTAPLDEDHPVPSCRNADSAWHEGQYVLTVDGFLATDNVEVKESSVLDTGFRYSDHNPVEMTFILTDRDQKR